MKKYVCSICGFVYEEEYGVPENGIAPGTLWEDLPEGWVCPICGADKSLFSLKEEEPVQEPAVAAPKTASPAPKAEPAPAKADAGMKKYVCSICGFIYEEEYGMPEFGVAAGTRWEDLPEGWVCPICGADKSLFSLKEEEPEAKAAAPAAPMRKYVCSICGFVYEEEFGIPDNGIAPGTRWEDLPEGWVCPICGADKTLFSLKDEEPAPAPEAAIPVEHIERELSAGELSALCSNLALGCEKQYKDRESKLFRQIADYFKAQTEPVPDADAAALLELVEKDLSAGFPAAKAAAQEAGDRGALRALTWSEKVTRILKNLLDRYEKEGEAMLKNTGVYVCTVCGFVFVGDELPAVCPVCKVPNWKFMQIKGRA